MTRTRPKSGPRPGIAWLAAAPMVVVVWAALVLAGCSTTPDSRYYLLSGEPQAGEGIGAQPRQRITSPTVFVDEATVAPYLDRPELATRVGSSRVAFAEFDVWAEPLASLITRAVVDDLGQRFSRDRVLVTPPRLGFDPDYRLILHVLRFDATESGTVVMDARWTLLAGRQERFVDTGREVITVQAPAARPIDATDDGTADVTYDARVAALSGAVRTLAGRIGDAIAYAEPGRL